MATQKQKLSPIGINQKIDYKDIDLLKLFLTEQGKILPTTCNRRNCSTTTPN